MRAHCKQRYPSTSLSLLSHCLPSPSPYTQGLTSNHMSLEPCQSSASSISPVAIPAGVRSVCSKFCCDFPLHTCHLKKMIWDLYTLSSNSREVLAFGKRELTLKSFKKPCTVKVMNDTPLYIINLYFGAFQIWFPVLP